MSIFHRVISKVAGGLGSSIQSVAAKTESRHSAAAIVDLDADIVIVGGGAAGLSARAEANSRGLSTILFEAQSRIGGRVWTGRDSRGMPVDFGAQLLNGDMTHTLEIARAANAYMSPLPATGRSLLVSRGEVIERATGDTLGPGGDRFNPSKILARPRDMTATEVIAGLVDDPDEAELTRAMLEELFGQPANLLSAKGIADMASKWHSPRGDAEFQLREGMSSLLDKLADQGAGPIHLDSAVERIDLSPDRVVVRLADRDVCALGAVIAVPPTVARQIELPFEIASEVAPLLESYIAGDMIKVTLIYSTPFWRRSGLSGGALVMEEITLTTIDGSRDDGTPPRLVVFIGGRGARRLAPLGSDERRHAILASLVSAFGQEAGRPDEVLESVWVDHPWSGGGYNAAIRFGGISDAGDRLMTLGGRIVFAGAEYAPVFRGFVEGALRSGKIAVERLGLHALQQFRTTL